VSVTSSANRSTSHCRSRAKALSPPTAPNWPSHSGPSIGSSRGRCVTFRVPLRIRYPGRLQLDHSPGAVVHFRYRQAEPVPQAPQPFAAGPGDRLFQLSPVDGTSRAAGGVRRGCRARRGQAAWALRIWRVRIPGHCALLGGLGLGRDCVVSTWRVPLWAAAELFTTHDRPQDSPQNDPQKSVRTAFW
jgi:hypothetical protein